MTRSDCKAARSFAMTSSNCKAARGLAMTILAGFPRNDVLGLLQGKALKLVCAAADKLKVQFADSIRKAYVCCKGFPDI